MVQIPKIIFLVAVWAYFSGCKEDDLDGPRFTGNVPEFLAVSPSNAKIGDFITITGTHMNELIRVELGGIGMPILEKSPSEVRVKVPEIALEAFEIRGVYQGERITERTNPLPFNLIGVFSLNVNFGSQSRPNHIQVLNDSVFVLNMYNGSFSRIWRTINGGGEWQELARWPLIHAIHYLSADSGLISQNNEIYLATNGGNFEYVTFLTQETDNELEEEIVDIKFSGSTGLLLSGKGEIYRTSKNDLRSYDLIYKYPFSLEDSSTREFTHLEVLDPEHYWAVGFAGTLNLGRRGTLLKSEGGEVSIIDLAEINPINTFFFDLEHGLLKADGYYRTQDGGVTWSRAEEIYMREITFNRSGNGLGTVLNVLGNDVVYRTDDYGQTWSPIYTTNSLSGASYVYNLSMNETRGILGSLGGEVWKYRD